MGSVMLHMIVLGAAEDGGGSAADLPIFAIIVFVVMATVLYKFAWGPLRLALDDRESNLSQQLDEAKQRNEKAERLFKENEVKLAGAKAEIEALIAQAREDAETQKQLILQEAQRAANAEKTRAVREINAAKNEALQELADRSVGTAVDLAGRIVGQQLTPTDHANLIEEALQKFSNKN